MQKLQLQKTDTYFQAKIIESGVSLESMQECFYKELETLAKKLLPDTRNVLLILSESFESLRNQIAKYDTPDEVRNVLHIKILQACNTRNEYLSEQYRIIKENHYNRMIFYLSYFLPAATAIEITSGTFSKLKNEFFSFEQKDAAESFIKVTALRETLRHIQTASTQSEPPSIGV